MSVIPESESKQPESEQPTFVPYEDKNYNLRRQVKNWNLLDISKEDKIQIINIFVMNDMKKNFFQKFVVNQEEI